MSKFSSHYQEHSGWGASGPVNELLAYGEQCTIVSYEIALVYDGPMEHDAALIRLERASEERKRFVVDVKMDLAFQNLHSGPRFKVVIQKMGLDGVPSRETMCHGLLHRDRCTCLWLARGTGS